MKNRQNVQGESYEVLRSSRERNGELCAERTSQRKKRINVEEIFRDFYQFSAVSKE